MSKLKNTKTNDTAITSPKIRKKMRTKRYLMAVMDFMKKERPSFVPPENLPR
ncbi:hypothetical protein [Nitrosomonas sp. JL21]|uniref:hypothetical protein n=1 Tax=Nitrosomonas sp. JL21 TaxID=153949 RepID=UPI00136DDAED|nr:hypothetical protein [Nitrosomonas sp. JL21]MBL8497694.1 hypothetical protein [Nitrosomonas sp.]